uniref:DNA-binding protein n=1 Tax=Desulfobacca acetoxidans TaxID=60893 RepID=A0A7C3Z1G5_9BACT
MFRGESKLGRVARRALLVATAAILVMLFIQGAAIPAAKGTVDINSATQAELETVKGIGPVTAKKIIDNRPYTSLADLKKAGLSDKEISAFKSSLTVKPAPAAPAAAPHPEKTLEPAAGKKAKAAKAPAPAAATLVDLNTADQKTLESLPGIGPALATRIMDARPIRSLEELAKVKGMTKAKVAALKDKVTLGPVAPAAKTEIPPEKPAPAQAAPPQPATAKKPEAAKLAPGERVNLNTASQEELEKIPGIGPVKAKAIIAGRPYKTPEDIMKVRGIKEGIYRKIKDYITVQ